MLMISFGRRHKVAGELSNRDQNAGSRAIPAASASQLCGVCGDQLRGAWIWLYHLASIWADTFIEQIASGGKGHEYHDSSIRHVARFRSGRHRHAIVFAAQSAAVNAAYGFVDRQSFSRCVAKATGPTGRFG